MVAFTYPSSDDGTITAAVVATATAATVTLYAFYHFNSNRNRNKHKPWQLAPGKLPIVGHLHLLPDLPKVSSALGDWADQYGKETGCYEVFLANDSHVVIHREDLAVEVLKQRPKGVYRSANLRAGFASIGASGVFNAEGHEWLQHRKLVSAALNRNHLRDYLLVMKDLEGRLTDKWASRCQSNTTTNIIVDDDLSHLNADVISMVAMGEDYDFLVIQTHSLSRMSKLSWKALSNTP
jgi:cytochrome P450